MPSQTRRRRKRKGKTITGKMPVRTKADNARIRAGYNAKYDEYSKLSLEELQKIKEENKEKKTIGGSYLEALDSVIQHKEWEQKLNKDQEKPEDEEVVEST